MILNNLSILPFYKVTTYNPTPRDCERWWAYGNVWPLITPGIPPIQIQGSASTCRVLPYSPNTSGGFSFTMISKMIDGQVYSYQSEAPATGMGRYYIETVIDGNRAVSDVFTMVQDTDPYLKLEWWDDSDFIMDAGALVYTHAPGVNGYKNVLYLPTDIAKPEYIFEEEGASRDGYFFPVKQISEKRYHFRFLAPEYILDVMRLIRMSDHIVITYKGQTFYPDTFLMTPTWEGDGYLANVECEFDTNTVAKKIGRLIANN